MTDADALTEAQKALVTATTVATLGGVGHFVSRGDRHIEHPHWPENAEAPARDDIRKLILLGAFQTVEQPGQGTWVFALTDDGIRLGRWLGAPVPAELQPFPASLEWLDMVRVLETLVQIGEEPAFPGFEDYAEHVAFGQLATAMQHANRDRHLLRAIRHLADDDYVEIDERNPPEASRIRLRPRTLQLLRGWPSIEPENVARRLDEALAAAIDRTDDPEEKTRLQRLRENARDVGKSVLAGAILTAGRYAAGGGV